MEAERFEPVPSGLQKVKWSKLNHLQLGRYAEYFIKMEFTLFGFDVYTAEVDDKGIDFVIRSASSNYFDIQVKSVRNLNYIFFPKATFVPKTNLLAAIVLFPEGGPARPFLVPSTTWLAPNALFVSRDYGGKLKSKPEWGMNLSQKNLVLLKPYDFSQIVETLL
jgi:hypothetical protein